VVQLHEVVLPLRQRHPPGVSGDARHGRVERPRVGYWEPAKWVAKLRATKTDDHVLLLRTNMGAGHGGASGRYDALHEWAIRYAFILDQILPQGTTSALP